MSQNNLNNLIFEELNKEFDKPEAELIFKCRQSTIEISSLSPAELDSFELLEEQGYLAKAQMIANEEDFARFGAEPKHVPVIALAVYLEELIQKRIDFAEYERLAKKEAEFELLRKAKGSEAWKIERQNLLMKLDNATHLDKLVVRELSKTLGSYQAEWLFLLHKSNFPDFLLLPDEVLLLDSLFKQGYIDKSRYGFGASKQTIEIIKQAKANAEKQLMLDASIQGEGSEAWEEARQLSIEKLNMAARVGNLTAFNILSKRFLNTDIPDKEGKTAFHHAAMHGKIEIMSALLQRNANINAADNDGNTPLLLASKLNSTGITAIVFLLKNGANVHATNNDGEDAIAVARKRKNWAILDVLEDYTRSEKEKVHLDSLIEAEQVGDEIAFGF